MALEAQSRFVAVVSQRAGADQPPRTWLNDQPGHLPPVRLGGVISSYLTGEPPGPANYVNLVARTALMQGFNALDEWGRFDDAFAALRRWEQEGRLVHR